MATTRCTNRSAVSASPALTCRHAIACLNACFASFALPAAVNNLARRFPGSDNAASAQFRPALVAARRS